MQTGDFLRFLWWSAGHLEGDVTFWTKQGKRSTHLPVQDALAWDEEDDQSLAELSSDRKDIYISPGLRRRGLDVFHHGTEEDVIALCAFVLDVDVFHPDPRTHKARNLPRTDEDIEIILGDAPEPTIAVSSGYGLQFWWVFDRVLELRTNLDRTEATARYRRFQEPFVQRANAAGFTLDEVANINHLFRLPGAKNWKLA
jgi:hypothetical protein